MKALVLSDKNQPFVYKEVADPSPGKGEAIIEIHAAALNHRDLWIQKGQYAGLKYPIVLGSDGVGIVRSTGLADDAYWLGKEVIINPSLHWGSEQSHQDFGKFSILGLPDDGTFAQFVKVPASNLVEKPAHLSYLEAASLPLAGLTAYRTVFSRAKIMKGEKVLITGIGGGVALFALQFALAVKAQVYVTSSSNEKIKIATQFGAAAGENYKQDNWVERLKQKVESFDVVIDGAAGAGTGNLFDLASPGGRVVFYGATDGNASNLEMRRIFWKQLSILGSTMGSATDFQSMVEFVNQHSIRPIIDNIFPIQEANAALRRMQEGKQFGKIILDIRQA